FRALPRLLSPAEHSAPSRRPAARASNVHAQRPGASSASFGQLKRGVGDHGSLDDLHRPEQQRRWDRERESLGPVRGTLIPGGPAAQPPRGCAAGARTRTWPGSTSPRARPDPPEEVEDVAKTRLELVEGIGAVWLGGGQEREVRVYLDPA